MNESKNKLIVLGQTVVAVIAAFFGFVLVQDAVFAVYLKINNGIYPPFMPEFVDTISFYIGGFIAGTLAIFILFRVKYKVQITLAIIFCIFLSLLKLRYDVQPEITVQILPYEVILGGGLLVVIYAAVTKYMAANKSSKSTPKGGAI